MPHLAFTCSYAPLPLIDAAGMTPHRLLPLGEAPERAGELLHENMCPHVKRVLDRALAGDVPDDLAGLVVVNSCDTMRRLADAWAAVRPDDLLEVIELPDTASPESIAFYAGELRRLARVLATRGGRPVTDESLAVCIEARHRQAERLSALARRAAAGTLPGGRAALQRAYNAAQTLVAEDADAVIGGLENSPDHEPAAGVAVLVFGNVAADPDLFDLIESCGCRVAGDDLCTGARGLRPLDVAAEGDPWTRLAGALLGGARCARTIDPARPASLGEQVVERARACGARGVIAHVMKFCDPYLARLPAVRRTLEDAGLAMLVIEGDCTPRAAGQMRTRIEAFAEMLGDRGP